MSLKSLIIIKELLGELKKVSTTLAQAKVDLNQELDRLKAEGRSESWLSENEKTARGKSLERVSSTMMLMNEARVRAQAFGKLYKNSYAVAGMLPVTSRGADGLSAENPVAEAMVRLQIINEASNLSDDHLKLLGELALSEGDYGRAYLLSTIDGNRAGINLPPSPEQQEALRALQEIEYITQSAELDYREMSGANPIDLSTSRLAVAHMATGKGE